MGKEACVCREVLGIVNVESDVHANILCTWVDKLAFTWQAIYKCN